MIRILVDAMGGDNAPSCNVQGALLALEESKEIEIVLVGQEEVILKELEGKTYDKERLTIVNATEVIETGEEPALSIRKKKDSSIVVAMKMLKAKDADAMVSCGSTGALLVGGQLVAGRIKGVRRGALAVLMPTMKGFSLLIDCGANVDARVENLTQFAVMGSIYMEKVVGIKNPTVGLVNIGVEEEKGNALCREAYPILQSMKNINFIGNAEARDLPYGVADVYVTEAFAGNIVLKLYEGSAKALVLQMKNALMETFRGKIGGLLIKPTMKKLMKRLDASEYGGAPILGLSGLIVKAHGNSTEKQMKNAILQCIDFKKNNVNAEIEAAIGEMANEEA